MAEELDIVDAELVEDNLPNIHGASLTLFGTDDPVAVIQQAERVASALKDVIEQKGLFKQIGSKKHVLVEGWTLLGSMLGVFPMTEWTRPISDWNGAAGWEARVLAVTRSGETVGTREAMCSRSESRWEKADDYAIRSMAQTRAVSGALSSPLRFIMELAGYSGTPEAEMHTAGAPEIRIEPQLPVPHSYAELEDLWKRNYLDVRWLEEATREFESQHGGKAGAFQMLATAYVRLAEQGPASPIGSYVKQQIQAVFAGLLDGVILELPEPEPVTVPGEDPSIELGEPKT